MPKITRLKVGRRESRAISRSNSRNQSRSAGVRHVSRSGISALILGAVGVIAGTSLPVSAATTPLPSSLFTGSTIANTWVLPTAPSGTNGACLTGGTGSTPATPIPSCGFGTPDSPGALRLTSNSANQVGSTFYQTSFPTSQGLDLKFNTYQWDNGGVSSAGADGIGFSLAATNPTDPSAPSSSGPVGGALGYSTDSNSDSGLADGYLGIGFDVFGNYSNTQYEGTLPGGAACPTLNANWQAGNRYPDSITVKGPGNGTTGYCILGSTAATELSAGPSGNNLPLLNSGALVTGTSTSLSVSPGTSESTSTAITYTATVSPVPDGGTVTFVDNGSAICSNVAVNTGIANCVVSAGNASEGSHEIVAVYSGDTNFRTSDTNSSGTDITETITGSVATATTTALTESPGTMEPISTAITYTATVRPVPAGGTVNFSDGGTAISGCTGVTVDTTTGIATCDVSSGYASSGRHTIVAGYSGATASQSSGASVTEVIGSQSLDDAGASGSALPASSTLEPVTTEIVLNSSASPVTPSGWTSAIPKEGWGVFTTPISFSGSVGSTGTGVELVGNLPSTLVSSPGYDATLASILPSSWVNPTTGIPYQLTFGWSASTGTKVENHEVNEFSAATYNGQIPTLQISNTDNVSGSFPKGGTATYTLTPTVASGQAAESNTMTVTDTLPTGESFGTLPSEGVWSCPTPSGQKVTCTYSPATAVAAGTTLAQISIPVTISATASGAAVATAEFSSTDGLPGSVTDSGTFVAGSLTATSLTASATPSSTATGTAATLKATGLPAGATGTVTFTTTGGVTLCGPATLSSGTASCATSTSLAAGTYPVTATYSGDSTYASSSNTTSFTLSAGSLTATLLTASATPASTTTGTAVTLGETGLPAGATGTVTFTTTGGVTLCGPITVSSGSASCATSTSLAAGMYPVTATYSGDSTYASTSNTTSFVLSAPVSPNSNSSVSLSAGALPLTQTYSAGDSVLLSATGFPTGATGTVSFATGFGTSLCTATVTSGEAHCLTSAALLPGNYEVLVSYSGDSSHAAATASTAFVVTPSPGDAMAAYATPASVNYGSLVTLKAAGLPVSASGTVTFISGSSALCTANVGVGAARCTTSRRLVVGHYSVVASYSGDAANATQSAATKFDITSGAPARVAIGAKSAQAPPRSNVTIPASLAPSTSSQVVLAATDPVSSSVIPAAHTGEPWSSPGYWILVSVIGASGIVLLVKSVRHRSIV